MSKQEVKKFYDLVKQDDELKKELIEVDKKIEGKDFNEKEFLNLIKDGIIPIAKKHGITLKEEEVLNYIKNSVQKISEEDLLEVSGGVSPRQAAIGLSAVLLMSLGAGGVTSAAGESNEVPATTISTSRVQPRQSTTSKRGLLGGVTSLLNRVPIFGSGIRSIANLFEKKDTAKLGISSQDEPLFIEEASADDTLSSDNEHRSAGSRHKSKKVRGSEVSSLATEIEAEPLENIAMADSSKHQATFADTEEAKQIKYLDDDGSEVASRKEISRAIYYCKSVDMIDALEEDYKASSAGLKKEEVDALFKATEKRRGELIKLKDAIKEFDQFTDSPSLLKHYKEIKKDFKNEFDRQSLRKAGEAKYEELINEVLKKMDEFKTPQELKEYYQSIKSGYDKGSDAYKEIHEKGQANYDRLMKQKELIEKIKKATNIAELHSLHKANNAIDEDEVLNKVYKDKRKELKSIERKKAAEEAKLEEAAEQARIARKKVMKTESVDELIELCQREELNENLDEATQSAVEGKFFFLESAEFEKATTKEELDRVLKDAKQKLKRIDAALGKNFNVDQMLKDINDEFNGNLVKIEVSQKEQEKQTTPKQDEKQQKQIVQAPVQQRLTLKELQQMANRMMLGMACGDAYGVQYEFAKRDNPAISEKKLPNKMARTMLSWGTDTKVPEGMWSDDTSMTLCAMDSIVHKKSLDLDDTMERFSKWCSGVVAYAPNGYRFDKGEQVWNAIEKYNGIKNKTNFKADFTTSAGNGALMRIIPMSFYLAATSPDEETDDMLKLVEDSAELTHNNKYSSMGCVIYTLMNKYLILDKTKDDAQTKLKKAFNKAIAVARNYYGEESMEKTEPNSYIRYELGSEREVGKDLLYSRLSKGYDEFKEAVNKASDLALGNGYTPVTLESVMYCLMNTNNYADCIKKAVSLGHDTDTVASIAGATAGLLYGTRNIPANWTQTIVKVGDPSGKVTVPKKSVLEYAAEFAKTIFDMQSNETTEVVARGRDVSKNNPRNREFATTETLPIMQQIMFTANGATNETNSVVTEKFKKQMDLANSDSKIRKCMKEMTNFIFKGWGASDKEDAKKILFDKVHSEIDKAAREMNDIKDFEVRSKALIKICNEFQTIMNRDTRSARWGNFFDSNSCVDKLNSVVEQIRKWKTEKFCKLKRNPEAESFSKSFDLEKNTVRLHSSIIKDRLYKNLQIVKINFVKTALGTADSGLARGIIANQAETKELNKRIKSEKNEKIKLQNNLDKMEKSLKTATEACNKAEAKQPVDSGRNPIFKMVPANYTKNLEKAKWNLSCCTKAKEEAELKLRESEAKIADYEAALKKIPSKEQMDVIKRVCDMLESLNNNYFDLEAAFEEAIYLDGDSENFIQNMNIKEALRNIYDAAKVLKEQQGEIKDMDGLNRLIDFANQKIEIANKIIKGECTIKDAESAVKAL